VIGHPSAAAEKHLSGATTSVAKGLRQGFHRDRLRDPRTSFGCESAGTDDWPVAWDAEASAL